MQLKYISEIEEENAYRKDKDKISINRETLSNEKRKIPREIRLTCLKNRSGKSNFAIDFEFNPCFNFFEEIERSKQTKLS